MYTQNKDAKFSTYAYKCIWGQLTRYTNYYNKEVRYKVNLLSLNYISQDNDRLKKEKEFIEYYKDEYENDDYKEIDLIDFIKTHACNIKDIDAIVKYKMYGKNSEEISKALGISKQAVIYRIGKLKKIIKQEYLAV